MDFGSSKRRPPAESIVPMINVVFLLLIFFLMTATIAPPDPFEVEVPDSVTDTPAEPDQALYIGEDGQLAWGEYRDDAIFPALSAVRAEFSNTPDLIIRADRRVKGAAIASLLKRLAEAGVSTSQLVVAAQ